MSKKNVDKKSEGFSIRDLGEKLLREKGEDWGRINYSLHKSDYIKWNEKAKKYQAGRFADYKTDSFVSKETALEIKKKYERDRKKKRILDLFGELNYDLELALEKSIEFIDSLDEKEFEKIKEIVFELPYDKSHVNKVLVKDYKNHIKEDEVLVNKIDILLSESNYEIKSSGSLEVNPQKWKREILELERKRASDEYEF